MYSFISSNCKQDPVQNHLQQGCIPVGCVPPANLLTCRLLAGNKRSGVCLFTTIQHPVGQTDACKNITFARFAMRAVKMQVSDSVSLTDSVIMNPSLLYLQVYTKLKH